MRLSGSADGRIVALVVGLALSLLDPPIRLSAQSLFRPDERVHLTDFSVVTAIAASPFWVYAATTGGLTIFDRRFHRWELPVTVLDGYPAPPRRVLVALADPGQESVWLGLSDGWARYVPDLRRWETGATAGPVRSLMFDLDDLASGIYLNVGGTWHFLPRGSAIPMPARSMPDPGRRVMPLDPNTALERAPGVEALRQVLLMDVRLRTYRFTSAARSADREELFFGTDGLGVLRLDPATTESEELTYGLLSGGTGAIAATPQGFWVATSAHSPTVGTSRTRRTGLTFVRQGLSDFRTIEGPAVTGLAYTASRALLAWGGSLWLATDRGLIRFDQGGGIAGDLGLRDGLPDDDVRSLAPAPDGVWVGTRRGLGHVSETGRVSRIARDFTTPVISLVALGDTVWIGTPTGLVALLPGADRVVVPTELDSVPELKTAIVSLTRAGSTVVAATQDHVGWRNFGRWSVARPTVSVGSIKVARADGDGVWLGGTAGVTYWTLGASATRLLRAPGDLPAAVRDLAVDSEYLWVATDAGVVRFTRAAALGR